MASIFTGTAAPDVNTTKTTATTAPTYYTDYLTDLSQAGQTQLGKTPEQLVAPLTAMQQQGYAAVPGAATSYQPGLSAAEQTAANAANVSPAEIQSYMNPYTTNVVNEMERLAQQNLSRNLMPQLKAQFVGTGGLGGRRYAGATGQTLTDWQNDLLGKQTGALQSGYSEALKAALQEQQNQTQAAQTQGALAGKEQELGLTGAGALTKAGAEQQAYEQSLRDAQLKNATNVSALLRSYNIPTSVTEKFTGPIAGVYGNSPLSQIAGLSSLIGSAFNTTAGGGTPWGTNLLNWLTGGSSTSGGTTGGTGGVTADEQAVLDAIAKDKAAAAASGQTTTAPTADEQAVLDAIKKDNATSPDLNNVP